MSLHTLAQHLQSAGRGEDKVLVHMTPKEVSGLQSLAMAHGGSLSINPKTGLPEAGFLSTILPIVAGMALGPAGVGLTAMQAGLATAAAGTAITGSLGKGLMMGLGAYGGAGMGAGFAAAGAAPSAIPVQSVVPSVATPGANAATNLGSGFANTAPNILANPLTSATGGGGINVLASPTSSFVPATTQATGQTVFEKFKQVGRGFGNVFGGGEQGDAARDQFMSKISKPQMYGMGLSALMAARQEQQEELERQMRAQNKSVGPYKPAYTFDSGYNATAPAQGLSGEREYFNPTFTPVRYAEGGGVMALPQMGSGPVEQMSNLNAIGANTRYPMANMTAAKYATSTERPISENVITPMTNYNVDPYTGEQRFAGGGLAGLARYAEGGKTMTLAAATQLAKSEGVKSMSSIGGAQGLADRYGATLTVGSKTYTPSTKAASTSSGAGSSGAGSSGGGGGGGTSGGINLITSSTPKDVTGPPASLSQAGMSQARADATGQPVTSGGVTYQPKVTNEIDVPDLSAKQLKAYTKLPALEDFVLRETGLERLTVAQKSQLGSLIKNKQVNNYTLENLVNDWAPKLDEQPYIGLSTLPKELGGKGKEPVFGDPPKGTTATGEYYYDSNTGRYVPKDEDSNIYISNKPISISKVSDLDPVTIALYGRKATLSDFVAYDTKKLGQKLSLADVYYDMSQSEGYQDFLSDQELAYINKFSATPSQINQIYRDLFGKSAPAGLEDKYGAMTPDQVRQALISSPEYEEYLNRGIKPDLTVDEQTGQIKIPGAIDRPIGPAVTAAGDIAYNPTYGGGASSLPPINRTATNITPEVSSIFTPNYFQSPIQNAIAPEFTPSSVFTLPSVSMQNAPAQPLVSTGALPSPTNMFAQSPTAASSFNPYANLTPDQISKLSPQELQQYLSSMQTPVSSNIFSSGTYKPFAEGGMAGGDYHLGDYSDGGRLLKGPGDGVSDSIPASISGRQPARLANNEFVIPARIVSEIGNGSTDAGARKLYEMMDKVQRRRSKTVGKGKIAVDSKAYKELEKL